MCLHDASPQFAESLLSLADADHLLTQTAIRTPAVRLAQNGTVLPEQSYTSTGASIAGRALSGLVDARRLLDLFDGGATVVLQGLHRYWPALTALTAELELALGHPGQVNAYLTPPGAQGFAVHADTHDVFVVQTHGSKLWEIHRGESVEEVLMVPGRCLYLPTGTRHAARAQEGVSLHVTVGINQLTLRGLVERTIRAAVAEVPATHLPAGYTQDTADLVNTLGQVLDDLGGRIARLDPGAAVAAEVARLVSTRPTRAGGGLLDRTRLAALDDTTPLTRRPTTPAILEPAGDRLRLFLGDRVLEVPGPLRAALDLVISHDRITPADLAELLDESSRLVLCRRLVREGLLQVSP